MWFVSKKKYDEMERLCKMWKVSAEGADKRADAWEKVAISLQEDNKRLVAHEEEMLAKMEELEAKLAFVIRERDYYYDLLEDTSEVEEANR
jgi:hypothetical protein